MEGLWRVFAPAPTKPTFNYRVRASLSLLLHVFVFMFLLCPIMCLFYDLRFRVLDYTGLEAEASYGSILHRTAFMTANVLASLDPLGTEIVLDREQAQVDNIVKKLG
ncbi:hypothetical protein VIGAN_01233100 [Vigna angularis var. angularis]|uniref:Uncharacterized protein n=1 Tax=Vigna angularis var. angularis TaxID=157739 RepID=A0A0S3R218_PHAAN|nr:hypothetical protein VIGAN_01233100 [Vigna angularis var. angularis]